MTASFPGSSASARERLEAYGTAIEERRAALAATTSQVVRAAVWSIAATSGQYTPEAAPLLTVVDCASTFIHASVDQYAFNRLQVGTAAQFRFRGGETIYVTVAMLAGTGPRTLHETLAISPTEGQMRVHRPAHRPYPRDRTGLPDRPDRSGDLQRRPPRSRG